MFRRYALTPTVENRLRNARDRLLHSSTLSRAGKTPFKLIFHSGLVSVRHYAAQTRTSAPPLVLVAPLAVNMLIYDLFPERSLVRFFTSADRDVYLIDWGNPSRKHNHYSLATYVLEFLPICLTAIRRHSRTRVLDMHGWSMGGHLVLCHAGLGHDPDIGHIVVVGTAIDNHQSGALGRMARRLNQQLVRLEHYLSFNRNNLPIHWFYSPGWLNALNFKLTNPIASVQGYLDLLRHLDDRNYVIDHATQAAFLDHMVAYPGALARDMLLESWLANRFSTGTLTLGSEEVRFDRISQPILIISGNNDTLATSEAVSALLPLLHRCPHKTLLRVPGGHMGIVSGREAPSAIWPQTLSWLSETPLNRPMSTP